MNLLLPPGAFEAEAGIDCELEIYRYLSDEYYRECTIRPYDDPCSISRDIGARVFNVPVPVLCSPLPGKHGDFICETRQKLMAFTRVVSERQPRPNPWKRIGRAFGRDHSTVVHYTRKYRNIIEKALWG